MGRWQGFKKVIASTGVEYWYGAPRLLALRIGYFYENPNFGNRKFLTFGAGIRYDIYGFDFSYISPRPTATRWRTRSDSRFLSAGEACSRVYHVADSFVWPPSSSARPHSMRPAAESSRDGVPGSRGAAPRASTAVTDTVRILAAMVQFQHDADIRTSDDGRFVRTAATDSIIDAPPRDARYCRNHLLFLERYYEPFPGEDCRPVAPSSIPRDAAHA